MSSNDKNRNNSSRGHGPMRINEKPESFVLSIKKLMKSLSSFKILIFVAIILAALSSILSLVAPNKLSDLTDEISRGITINTTNMKELENDLTSNVSEIGSILDINLDENTVENLVANYDIEEDMIAKDNIIEFYKKIHMLDIDTREIIYLKIIRNFTFKEISQILGKNEEWARTKFYRGKLKLKESLQDEK